MMYLSKGVRVPSNDAGLFCVSHRGTTFPMGNRGFHGHSVPLSEKGTV